MIIDSMLKMKTPILVYLLLLSVLPREFSAAIVEDHKHFQQFKVRNNVKNLLNYLKYINKVFVHSRC